MTCRDLCNPIYPKCMSICCFKFDCWVNCLLHWLQVYSCCFWWTSLTCRFKAYFELNMNSHWTQCSCLERSWTCFTCCLHFRFSKKYYSQYHMHLQLGVIHKLRWQQQGEGGSLNVNVTKLKSQISLSKAVNQWGEGVKKVQKSVNVVCEQPLCSLK